MTWNAEVIRRWSAERSARRPPHSAAAARSAGPNRIESRTRRHAWRQASHATEATAASKAAAAAESARAHQHAAAAAATHHPSQAATQHTAKVGI